MTNKGDIMNNYELASEAIALLGETLAYLADVIGQSDYRESATCQYFDQNFERLDDILTRSNK